MAKRPGLDLDNLLRDDVEPRTAHRGIPEPVPTPAPVEPAGRKMGRPAVDRGPGVKRLAVELDRATFLELNRIKGETGRSFQDLLAEAAQDFIARMKKH